MTGSNRFVGKWGPGVAALVLVVSLAACGGKDFNSTVGTPVTSSTSRVFLASVRSTTAAHSARVSMRVSFAGGAVPGTALTLDGVSSFSTGNAEFVMAFSGPAARFLPGGIEMRMVDHVGYMKLPASLGGAMHLPPGVAWLKIPVAGAGAASPGLPGIDQSDPSKFLAYLEAVSDGVRAVGSDTIRGVATTHYKASLDFGKAIDRAQVPAALRDQVRQLLQSLEGSSLTIPVDVWIGSDGLLRRVEMKMDLAAFARGLGATGSSGAAGTMDMTMDLYDFGVPVNVEAPPANEITSLPQLGGAPSSPAL